MMKLTKFCFNLAMAFIRSANYRSALHALEASEVVQQSTQRFIGIDEEPTEFPWEPTTIWDRLNPERWPLHYNKAKVFY